MKIPFINKTDSFALIIILIGAVLRFYGFWDWSLSNDELSTLHRSQLGGFLEIIEKGIKPDVHPAFTEVFIHYWGLIFGYSTFFFRLPFVLVAIISQIFFYKLAANWLNKNAALIAISTFSICHLFILYGQIARPYSFGLFFILGFTYYWQKIITNNCTTKSLILYSIFGFLAAVSHYFALLGVIIIGISGLFKVQRPILLKYIIYNLAIFILFLPHLSITLGHIEKGGVGWLPEPKYNFIYTFLKYSFNNSTLFLKFLFLLPIISFFSGSYHFFKKKQLNLFLFFIIPYAIAFFYSLHRSPVLQYSVLIFFLPFLILFIASFFTEKSNLKLVQGLSLAILLFGTYTLLFSQEFYKKKRFANFKGVIDTAGSWVSKLGADNTLLLASGNAVSYFNYFSENQLEYDKFYSKERNIAEARNLINESKSNYAITAFANYPLEKEIHEYIKLKFPEIVEKKRYFNSEVTVYKQSEMEREKLFSTSFKSTNDTHWEVNSDYMDSLQQVYFVDSISQYAITYRSKMKDVFLGTSNFISIRCSLNSSQKLGAKLVISINRNGNQIDWQGLDLTDYWIKNEPYDVIKVLEKNHRYQADDELVIFLWNPEKNHFFVDDFEITNFADSDYNYYDF